MRNVTPRSHRIFSLHECAGNMRELDSLISQYFDVASRLSKLYMFTILVFPHYKKYNQEMPRQQEL